MIAPKDAPPDELSDAEAHRLMRVRSRRSFLGLAGGALAALGGWRWLRTRRPIGAVPYPLRHVLEFNEHLAEGYFSENRRAAEFPRAFAHEPRVNGMQGLSENFDSGAWRLHARSPSVDRAFTLGEIQALPRVEMTTDLKCIEGWSVVVTWAGARLRDLARAYGLDARTKYVSLETPDGAYYVGLDTASAMHPQTLLCYEMNGVPLTAAHGAPVRLVTTVKYGIKSIKRIGTIVFTDVRPRDYWAERGYDWYAGL